MPINLTAIYSCTPDPKPEDYVLQPCYGTVMGAIGLRKDYKEDFVSCVYYLPRKELTIKQANWYLHKFILPCMPERMREKVKITRIFKKYTHEFAPNSEFLRNKTAIPWIRVDIDTSTMSYCDFYALVCSLRMAQEAPHCVTAMMDLLGRYPALTISQAHFLACFWFGGPGGHSLLYAGSIKDWGEYGRDPNTGGFCVLAWDTLKTIDDIGEHLRKYDFAERWESLPTGYSGSVSDYFGLLRLDHQTMPRMTRDRGTSCRLLGKMLIFDEDTPVLNTEMIYELIECWILKTREPNAQDSGYWK